MLRSLDAGATVTVKDLLTLMNIVSDNTATDLLFDKVGGVSPVNTLMDSYTGQFLTPQWTGPDPTGTAFTGSRTPAQVTIRPNHLKDANLDSPQRSTNRWFDPTAFGPPTLGLLDRQPKA